MVMPSRPTTRPSPVQPVMSAVSVTLVVTTDPQPRTGVGSAAAGTADRPAAIRAAAGTRRAVSFMKGRLLGGPGRPRNWKISPWFAPLPVVYLKVHLRPQPDVAGDRGGRLTGRPSWVAWRRRPIP